MTAIKFLVENADEVGFDRRTPLNLYAILAQELLPDRADGGRLGRIAVGIGHSTYLPETVPHIAEAVFLDMLRRIDAVGDLFEQAPLTLGQLPYLQPLMDVDKRVSRQGESRRSSKSSVTRSWFRDKNTST